VTLLCIVVSRDGGALVLEGKARCYTFSPIESPCEQFRDAREENGVGAVASFVAELKRRRVVRAATVYTAVAFVLVQVADIAFPALHLPEWTLTFVVAMAILGLPMTVGLAWVFDVTPHGLTRTPVTATTAQPAAAEVDEASVAVLPFINISPEPENEYFSDGLTEELLNMLAQVEGLRVPARTSSFAFKGRNTDIRKIGERLRVRTVLEGSVRKADERVMITAQLINVADGYHLWSGTYKRELKDIFTVQEEIARAIVGTLRVRLLGGSSARPTSQHTTDSASYTLYLKGRFFANRRSENGFRKAIECFQDAVARDPAYALAYAGLADAYALLSDYNLLPPKEGMPRAKEAALKALALDDSLAEAHTSLAMIRHDYDWDYTGSEREYLRALELNPAYATAHHWYGEFLALMGRFAEGIARLEQAQQLDPLSLTVSADKGAAHYYARESEKAIAQLRKTLELDSNFAPARHLLALAYAEKGLHSEARSQLEHALQIAPDTPRFIAALAHVHAAAGDMEQARQALATLDRVAAASYVSPYDRAIGLAAVGDTTGAFAALNRAVDERIFQAVHLKVDPLLDDLRPDSRFVAVLRRLGLS
jgi:TolB-like protein/tetratricopeptide (TPR) repeat protein